MFLSFLRILLYACVIGVIYWLNFDLLCLAFGLILVRFKRTYYVGLFYLNGSLLCPGKLIYKYCRRCDGETYCNPKRCAAYEYCSAHGHSEN